jgi:NAD(P)-dependent dehydrogenase (short-subunit alcohol dehydrogenase family)
MTTAFVTGGSRGLGLATARVLHDAGIKPILFARESEKLTNAANELNTEWQGVELSDIQGTRRVFESAITKFGLPDILILAHGVMSEKLSKTIQCTPQEWERVMDINLNSVFNIVNIVGAQMAEKREGRIIIFSACMGRMSGPGNTGGFAPYRISKAGVNALVRNFSHETSNGKRGLFIDATCPDHCRTDMGGPNAPRSAEEGADTAYWLATRELIPGDTPTGLLWENREIVPW